MPKAPKLMTEKQFKKYHKCLIKYKGYLGDSFKKNNAEKTRLKKELAISDKYEDRFYGGKFTKSQKGGIFLGKFRPNARLKDAEKCVKAFQSALDKEEKVLKDRLAYIKSQKDSIKRNVRNAIQAQV